MASSSMTIWAASGQSLICAACAMASMGSPLCWYQRAARWCRPGTRPGYSRRSIRRISAPSRP